MGRMYRPVELFSNGRSTIAVSIIDTGSDETVVRERITNKLKAKLYGKFTAICASQTEVVGKYADIKVKDSWSGLEALMEVGVSSIPFDTDDIDDEGLDVILGVDFIQETGLKIEFLD